MLPQQRPGSEPLPNLSERDPRAEQLRARDHPVRSRRHFGEHRLYGAGLVSHYDT
jgi:hypothetical protein